jgi:hypothetical protein
MDVDSDSVYVTDWNERGTDLVRIDDDAGDATSSKVARGSDMCT